MTFLTCWWCFKALNRFGKDLGQKRWVQVAAVVKSRTTAECKARYQKLVKEQMAEQERATAAAEMEVVVGGSIFVTSTCSDEEFARTFAEAIFTAADAGQIALCEKLLFAPDKSLRKMFNGIEFMLRAKEKYGPTGRAAVVIQAAVRRWIASRHFTAVVLLQRAFRKHLITKNDIRLEQHRYFTLDRAAVPSTKEIGDSIYPRVAAHPAVGSAETCGKIT